MHTRQASVKHDDRTACLEHVRYSVYPYPEPIHFAPRPLRSSRVCAPYISPHHPNQPLPTEIQFYLHPEVHEKQDLYKKMLLKEHMEKVDKDQDGKISYEEHFGDVTNGVSITILL